MSNHQSTVQYHQPGAFYEDLEGLLREEMRKHPARLDIHVKLAELYSQTRRVNDFVQLARQVRASVAAPQNSDEWRRIASMGRVLHPDEPLFHEPDKDAVGYKTAQTTAAHSRLGDEARFRKPLQDLAIAYEAVRRNSNFLADLDAEMAQYSGSPSPLEPAHRLSEHLGGARIFLKRNDVGTRQPHVTSAIVGQALLAKKLGRKSLVAASGKGHSGALVASVAAKLGMSATIFMSAEQAQLQRSNVFRMRLCGADVEEVDPKGPAGSDVRKAALEHWARFPNDSFLVMGLDSGPHPYPMMMLEFTSLVGRECRRQMYAHNKKAPDLLVARSGENADAIGLFPPFLRSPNSRLVCVGAADGFGVADAAASQRRHSVFTPSSQPLTTSEQQRAARILEGLDYPSVAREQAWLQATGRVEYVKIDSAAAMKAINDLSRREGIIPAVESAYALAWACRTAAGMSADQTVVVLLGENVEKDIWEIGKAMGVAL